MFPTLNGNSAKREFQVTVDFYLGKDDQGNKVRDSRVVPLSSDDPMRIQHGYTHKMYTSPKVNLYNYLEQKNRLDLLSKYGISYKDGSPIYFTGDSEEYVRPIIELYCVYSIFDKFFK